jgi:hypothetical protein
MGHLAGVRRLLLARHPPSGRRVRPRRLGEPALGYTGGEACLAAHCRHRPRGRVRPAFQEIRRGALALSGRHRLRRHRHGACAGRRRTAAPLARPPRRLLESAARDRLAGRRAGRVFPGRGARTRRVAVGNDHHWRPVRGDATGIRRAIRLPAVAAQRVRGGGPRTPRAPKGVARISSGCRQSCRRDGGVRFDRLRRHRFPHAVPEDAHHVGLHWLPAPFRRSIAGPPVRRRPATGTRRRRRRQAARAPSSHSAVTPARPSR